MRPAPKPRFPYLTQIRNKMRGKTTNATNTAAAQQPKSGRDVLLELGKTGKTVIGRQENDTTQPYPTEPCIIDYDNGYQYQGKVDEKGLPKGKGVLFFPKDDKRDYIRGNFKKAFLYETKFTKPQEIGFKNQSKYLGPINTNGVADGTGIKFEPPNDENKVAFDTHRFSNGEISRESTIKYTPAHFPPTPTRMDATSVATNQVQHTGTHQPLPMYIATMQIPMATPQPTPRAPSHAGADILTTLKSAPKNVIAGALATNATTQKPEFFGNVDYTIDYGNGFQFQGKVDAQGLPN